MLGTSSRLETSRVRVRPPPTPARAVPMGSPMASTDPNAKTSTRMAKAIPSISVWGGSRSPKAMPANSTRRPSTGGPAPASAWPTRLRRSGRCPRGSRRRRRPSRRSRSAVPPPVRTATRPPRPRPGCAPGRRIRPMASRTAGSLTPWGAVNTIRCPADAPRGKRASSRSRPSAASDPGKEAAALVLLPTTRTSPPMATTTVSHIRTVTSGRRTMARARRRSITLLWRQGGRDDTLCLS